MDSALKLKIVLTVGLFVATALCILLTIAAKEKFRLGDVNFGRKATYVAADITPLMRGNSPTKIDPRAARFIAPILFPIDLLLLACLGGFGAMTSLLLGEPARVPAPWIPLLVVVPVVYMACDLAENCLLTRVLLLPSADAVTDTMVDVVRAATKAKFLFLYAGTVQLAGLSAFAVYFHYRP